MPTVCRQATSQDIPAIWRVRYAVRENTLRPGVIRDEDVRREIEDTGRGWVVESDGAIVAFAIGNATNGNIWALFVDPDAEGRGHGARLLGTMTDWLRSRGLRSLWLTTGEGTRAHGFYAAHGWHEAGRAHDGDLRMERPC